MIVNVVRIGSLSLFVLLVLAFQALLIHQLLDYLLLTGQLALVVRMLVFTLEYLLVLLQQFGRGGGLMVVTGRIRTRLRQESSCLLMVKGLGRRALVRGGRRVEGLGPSGLCDKFHFLIGVGLAAVVAFVTEEAKAVGCGVREPLESKCDLFQVFLALTPVLICFQVIEVAIPAILLGFVVY